MKPVIVPATGCYVQGNLFCSGIEDCRQVTIMMAPQVLISGLLLLLPAVWSTTVTSSYGPWNNHTEVVPTQPPLKISTKDLYIGISVSAALLILLASALTIIKCRQRQKKILESSVVFAGFQNEVFQSTAQPQAVDNVYVIKDSELPVVH
ncbi:hepatitis A virus cellular receptor 1 homolog [Grammomys surdaster]|uniref:hepatitis A virus cellular receptor 1 homolog n=1 Tax=Grammomys surdaster TaxID=491861 RepID=UPI00109F16E8|nr:hepatitis A virus cellular receptor 1 homolog [Grammomys surdaster]